MKGQVKGIISAIKVDTNALRSDIRCIGQAVLSMRDSLRDIKKSISRIETERFSMLAQDKTVEAILYKQYRDDATVLYLDGERIDLTACDSVDLTIKFGERLSYRIHKK